MSNMKLEIRGLKVTTKEWVVGYYVWCYQNKCYIKGKNKNGLIDYEVIPDSVYKLEVIT